jgi:hypothetical protein
MIVEVLEELAVLDELLLKPGAIIDRKVLQDPLVGGAVDLTHVSRIPSAVLLQEPTTFWRYEVFLPNLVRRLRDRRIGGACLQRTVARYGRSGRPSST